MATREEILSEVQAILIQTFKLEPEEVTPEKNLFTDLDLDSLDAIDLASELTSRTKIKFNNEDLRSIRTVGDVVEAIISKKGEGN